MTYEYYATTSRSNFLSQKSINTSLAQAKFEILSSLEDNQSTVNQVRNNFNRLVALSNKLDITLSSENISWDLAREQLKDITRLGQETVPLLDTLVNHIQEHIKVQKAESSKKLELMALLANIFSLAIILIAILTGLQIRQYLADAREKKRLALFIERNPNPVATLNWTGHITYENAAWQKKKQLHGQILPNDINTLLDSLKHKSSPYFSWHYDIGEHHYLASLHRLGDLKIFNIYIEDITQKRQTEKELEFLAYHDPLTQLPNRKKLELDANKLLTMKKQHYIGLMIIGIDRFNQVTSSHGFSVGDSIINAVKEKLQKILSPRKGSRPSVSLYRFTGAKFVILIHTSEAIDLPSYINNIVADIQKALKDFVAISHGHFYLNLSMGSSFIPVQASDYQTLLRNADAAQSLAQKNGGGIYYCYAPSMTEKEQNWLAMEVDIRLAIANKDFFLVYQPKICSLTGKITGTEALVRWNHHKRGFISPLEFISIAEQSGLIIQLGEWILEEACRQTLQWIERGIKGLVCAVNISPMQFMHFNFLDTIKTILIFTGLPPENLELEITEGVLMNDVDYSISILKQLHELGLKLSIDDFGTGYSSLNYLKSFPLDKLKIDKSFIDHITTDSADKAITRTIIELAKNLKLTVIAEGVETDAQLKQLQQYGCDEIQGYYFSKPLAPDDFFTFAHNNATTSAYELPVPKEGTN